MPHNNTNSLFGLAAYAQPPVVCTWDLITSRMPDASLQKGYHWPFTLLPRPPSANSPAALYFPFLLFYHRPRHK